MLIEFLAFLKKMLRGDNELCNSAYEAKKELKEMHYRIQKYMHVLTTTLFTGTSPKTSKYVPLVGNQDGRCKKKNL